MTSASAASDRNVGQVRAREVDGQVILRLPLTLAAGLATFSVAGLLITAQYSAVFWRAVLGGVREERERHR